jgi:hypothetical protein
MSVNVKEISTYPSNLEYNQVLSQSGSYVYDSVNLGLVPYTEDGEGTILFKLNEDTIKGLIPVSISEQDNPLQLDNSSYRLMNGNINVTSDFEIYSRNKETFIELKSGKSFEKTSNLRLTLGYLFNRSDVTTTSDTPDSNSVLEVSDINIR